MKGRFIEKEEESKLFKNSLKQNYEGEDEETVQLIQEPLKQWLSEIELTEDIFCGLANQLLVLAEKKQNSSMNKDSDCYSCDDRSSNEESFSLQDIYVIIIKQNMPEKMNNIEDTRLFLRLSLKNQNKSKILTQRQGALTNLTTSFCNITPNSYRFGRILSDSRQKRQEIITKSDSQQSLRKPHFTSTDSSISQSTISCLTEILNLKTDTFTSLMRLQMARMFFQRAFKGTVTNSLQYFVVLLWKLSRDQSQISLQELRNILTAVILNVEKNPNYEIDRFIRKQITDQQHEQMHISRSYFRQYQGRLRLISCELRSQLNAATSNYLGYVHYHKSNGNYNDICNCSLQEFFSAQKEQEKDGVCQSNGLLLSSTRNTLNSLEFNSEIQAPSHHDVVADNRISDNHLKHIIHLRKALHRGDLNIDYAKQKQKLTSSVYQCNSIQQVIQLFSQAISQSDRVSMVSHVALQFFAQRKYKLTAYFAAQALTLFYNNLCNTNNTNTNTNKSSTCDDLNSLIREVYFALGAIFHSKLEHSKALKCLTAARRFNHRNAAQVLIFYSRRAADKEAVEKYLYETIRQPRKTLPFIPPSFSSKDTSEYLYHM